MTRLRPEGFAGRGRAEVVILPIVARPSFHDPAWCAQFDREMEAKRLARCVVPARTRPTMVVENDSRVTEEQFEKMMRGMRDAIKDSGR